MSARRAAGALALAFTMSSSAMAQGPGRPNVYTGFEYRSISFDSGVGSKGVTEMVVPIGVLLPLSSRLTVDLGTRYAQATQEPDSGSSTTISGLTDFQARAVLQIIPDVALLTVSANLPTGKTKLTSDELLVAGTIASDLLPFPVSSFGSGTSVTTGLALAIPVGGFAIGLAGSYRVSGAYTPLADTAADYKAGGEMRFRFGVERLIGQSRLSVGFTYSSFATDEFGGSNVFAPGNRYIGQASLNVPLGNMGLSLYAWNLYREEGAVPINNTTTEKQSVLTVGAAAAIQAGRSVFRPLVEYRRQTASDPTAGIGALEPVGTLLSLGLKYQMPMGNRLALLPGVRFDTGNIVGDAGTDVGYTGLSFSMSVRATL